MTKPMPETHRVKRVVSESVRATKRPKTSDTTLKDFTEVASSSSVKQEQKEEADVTMVRKHLGLQEKAIGSLIAAFKKMKPTLCGSFSLSLTRACCCTTRGRVAVLISRTCAGCEIACSLFIVATTLSASVWKDSFSGRSHNTKPGSCTPSVHTKNFESRVRCRVIFAAEATSPGSSPSSTLAWRRPTRRSSRWAIAARTCNQTCKQTCFKHQANNVLQDVGPFIAAWPNQA